MTEHQIKEMRKLQKEDFDQAPSYIHEEEENRQEYYFGKEMKNSEALKWLAAGVAIMGFFSILSALF